MSHVIRSVVLATLMLQPLDAHADWTINLDAPAGVSACPGIAEPFIYYGDTCEYLALRNVGANRGELWADQLIHAAAVRNANACAVPYSNFLWVDSKVYPISASAIVQHTRPYLTLFSKTLSGCQRAGGQAIIQTGPQRLLLANIDLAIAGPGQWYFDRTAGRAYLRVTTTTGDVVCSGAQTAPNFDDLIYSNDFE